MSANLPPRYQVGRQPRTHPLWPGRALTFAHGWSGGFEPVAGVAIALVVAGEVDAETAVAAHVGLGALVQV